MIIDFSKITIYEVFALALSIIAILIPIIQWAWKKCVVTTKLCFHPTGKGQLFFNQSGSYIRIDGVYEVMNKPATITKIAVKVTRQKDEQKKNLMWSSFISPVSQSMIGNYLQTMESAHPFRIEADSVSCAFTEFADPFDSFGKIFRNHTSVLFSKITSIQERSASYSNAVKAYMSLPEYVTAKQLLEKEFFWEIGKYSIDLQVCYGKEEKIFQYTITVGEGEYEQLKSNIDEALLSPLKRNYSIPWDYHSTVVELQKIRNEDK